MTIEAAIERAIAKGLERLDHVFDCDAANSKLWNRLTAREAACRDILRELVGEVLREAAVATWNTRTSNEAANAVLALTPAAGVRNQCDGCARGLPIRDGIHRGVGYDAIVCTADRYGAPAAGEGGGE